MKAFSTVYSYHAPEIKQIIKSVVDDYPSELIDEGWARQDLTRYQAPIFEQLVELHRNDVEGLQDFKFRYPTYGSDHAICEYLTFLVSKGVKSIYVLENDYEGFIERANSRGITPVKVRFADIARLTPGIFFLSNPSAVDGNIITNDVVNYIIHKGHQIVYDLAYLGTTWRYIFDLDYSSVLAAFISFSKPYGLFSQRVGFSFFRESVPSLEANGMWFKNIFGLTLASRIIEKLDHQAYVTKYKSLQQDIIDQVNIETGLPLQMSSSFLLAYIEDYSELNLAQSVQLEKYRRGAGYRFCLTPYFMERSS